MSESANKITAADTTVTYQWIDCDNGNTPMTGDTARSFIATSNGRYAVVLSKLGCSDTSECIEITGIGIQDNMNAIKVRLYPNPIKNELSIDFGTTKRNAKLILQNEIGQIVFEKSIRQEVISKIDMSTYKNGMYVLSIQTDNEIANYKVVKQ